METQSQTSTAASEKSVRHLRFCSIQAPEYPDHLLYKVTAIHSNNDLLAFGLEGGAIRVFDTEFDLISTITGHSSAIIGLEILSEDSLVSVSKTSCLVSRIEEDETIAEMSFYSNVAGFTVYRNYVIVSTMDKVLTILGHDSDELCVDAEFDLDITGSIVIREDPHIEQHAELIVLSDGMLSIFSIQGIGSGPKNWKFRKQKDYYGNLTTVAAKSNTLVCGTMSSNIR